jgi:hypothetical protein
MTIYQPLTVGFGLIEAAYSTGSVMVESGKQQTTCLNVTKSKCVLVGRYRHWCSELGRGRGRNGISLQRSYSHEPPFHLPFRSMETTTTTGMHRRTSHTPSIVRCNTNYCITTQMDMILALWRAHLRTVYLLSQNEGWMSVSCEIDAALRLSLTFRMLTLNGRCIVRRNYGMPDASLASTTTRSCAWPGGASANPSNSNVHHTEATTAETADHSITSRIRDLLTHIWSAPKQSPLLTTDHLLMITCICCAACSVPVLHARWRFLSVRTCMHVSLSLFSRTSYYCSSR